MTRIAVASTLALVPGLAHAQNAIEEPALAWMAWTWQTGLFFGAIAIFLISMTVWELLKPGGAPRTPGALGIDTTRGDRLFISLLGSAYIHLGWLALSSQPLWYATIVSVLFALAVFRWV